MSSSKRPGIRSDIDRWISRSETKKGKINRKNDFKKTTPETKFIEPGKGNATVIEAFPKLCSVLLDSSPHKLLCSYKRSAIFQNGSSEKRERTPVAVNDRVWVDPSGVVLGIETRRSHLSRLAPGRSDELIQVIAANIDFLVIVACPEDPKFSPGLVDRFLIAAYEGGAEPILCITKMDLWTPDSDEKERPWELYRKQLPHCFELFPESSEQFTSFKALLQGKAVAFCGHSGVGKTTLLRKLTGQGFGKTASVSPVTGKGRHTTTAASIVHWDTSTRWIDTPGIRSLGPASLSEIAIARTFPDLMALQCAGRGCKHLGEKQCDALDHPRYRSYSKVMNPDVDDR